MKKAALGVAVPVLAMATGHMLSNAVRTLPAISADRLVTDLAITPGLLAAMLGAFQLAFALCQIPLGVALDRFGVRRTVLTLFSVVLVGIVIAAMTPGAAGFLLAQVVMGVGCCGMLLCPVTYAAKRLSGPAFAIWPGLLLGVGNTGMLLSASPLAWLVEASGWRAGFWAAAGFGVLGMLLVVWLVRDDRPEPVARPASIAADMAQVMRMMGSPSLRGLLTIAFVSFSAMIGVRGLWGGPWLMEVKGLDRLAAGNVLLLATLALAIGPMLAGFVDRWLKHPRWLLPVGHLLAGLCLLLIIAGGPGGWLSRALGLPMMPVAWDTVLLLLFGLALGSQALIFVITRRGVQGEQAGKALAAVNMSFFVGAALLQTASGPVGDWGGAGAGLGFFAFVLIAASLLYARMPGAR